MMSVAYSEIWDQETLLQVACDSCGSDIAFRVAVRPDGLTVVECPRCGLAYLNPRPREEHILALYGEEYFHKKDTNSFRVGYDDYRAFAQDCWSSGHSWELDMIEMVAPLSGCRLVEIGCATGELLSLARLRGAFTVGVEISAYAAQAAQDRHRLDVRVGPLEALKFPERSFDVALALEVIEHVLSPRRFFEALIRLLKPGGILALSTPNYGCSLPLGDRWLGFHSCFEHLFFFSPQALMRLAASYRMSLIFWATRGNGMVNRESRVKSKLRAFAKKIPGVACLYRALKASPRPEPWEFFGRGHHLFALFRFNGHA